MARPAKDWVGKRKGRLVVIARTGTRGTCPVYLVKCDCGAEKELTTASLNGSTVSCGCFRKEYGTRSRHSHAAGKKSRTYKVWLSMRSRCHNPRSSSYARYGGAGIKVCPRWRRSFEAFLADMGQAPSGAHTIDRINSDRGYEPQNCRWATYQEQAQTKRTTRLDPDLVRMIRASDEAGVVLAESLGVSAYCISAVRTGKTWKNVL